MSCCACFENLLSNNTQQNFLHDSKAEVSGDYFLIESKQLE